jgi:hemerythrin-like domain-containing protein
MALPTQRIRDEHAALWPRIQQFRQTASQAGDLPSDQLKAAIEEAYLFLENRVIPHARAEDQVLYPVIARIVGSDLATRGMTRDHVEVGTLANELGLLRVELSEDEEPPREVVEEARRILYGLYALIKGHIDKEEEIFLTLVDANISEAETRPIFDRMDAVSKQNRFQVA